MQKNLKNYLKFLNIIRSCLIINVSINTMKKMNFLWIQKKTVFL